jgi:hypothetical protein
VDDVSERIDSTSRSLALGAVAVIGAGVSIDARFPLIDGLGGLLWAALDADLPARAALAANLGQPDGPAKYLVGDSPEALRSAWSTVATNGVARAHFQHQFARLDLERSPLPSPAHEGLATLIHARVVETVVSLNWDTALERAYRRLYGVPVPDGVLYKPHGDAAEVNTSWTLPDSPGHVPPELSRVIGTLTKSHARVLLVVGYSERDKVIIDELIAPLDDQWRSVRIGPSAVGRTDIPGPAGGVLKALAEPFRIREDGAAWRTVRFQGGRGIDAALRGERLSPSDVNACPELPDVKTIVDSLKTDRAVVLNGQSGTGKSISAYQALHQLTELGYETLVLRDRARREPPRQWIADLSAFPRRRALLIDDAQDLSADTVRELADHANEDTLVLVVGIDHVAGGVRTLRLNAIPAVMSLAQWVRNNRDIIFPLVHQLDANVGSFPTDVFFDKRIDHAEQAATPWEFFYRLSGGWRRVRDIVIDLRTQDRADMALFVTAVSQIAGVDAGSDVARLADLAGLIGRDETWMRASLVELRRRRLVIETDGIYRCVHLMTAYSVVEWMLHPPVWGKPPLHTEIPVPAIASSDHPSTVEARTTPKAHPPRIPLLPKSAVDSDRTTARTLLQQVLDSPSTPLRGLSWLAGSYSPGALRDGLRAVGLLGPERDLSLADRALSAKENDDVAAAAALLADACDFHDSSVLDFVKKSDGSLRAWFSVISPQNGWALGRLVNSLYNVDKEFARKVAQFADPRQLAQLIPSGGWPHSVSSSNALERLCLAGGEDFRKQVAAHLDHDALRAMFRSHGAEYWRALDLLADLLYVDLKFTALLLTENANRLARQFEADPVRRWNDTIELVIRMGYGWVFLRGRRPPAVLTRSLRAFVNAMDERRMAEVFTGPFDAWDQMNFDDCATLIQELAPVKFDRILDLIDLDRFEKSLSAAAQNPSVPAIMLAAELHAKRGQPVAGIFERLQPQLTSLHPAYALAHPETAVVALRRGLPLRLGIEHGAWGTAARVISSLSAVEKAVAAEVIHANFDAMIEGLSINSSDFGEGLAEWTRVCDGLTPGLLEEALGRLPKGGVARWSEALREPSFGRPSRRADVAPLVRRAATMNGHVAAEAQQLMRRFPSLQRV